MDPILQVVSSFIFYPQAAVTRIQTLEDATEEQLQAHADVCAICYSEMVTSAKVIINSYPHFQA